MAGPHEIQTSVFGAVGMERLKEHAEQYGSIDEVLIPIVTEITITIPANTYLYDKYDLYWTNFVGKDYNDDNYTQYVAFKSYSVYTRNEDVSENIYEKLSEFEDRYPNYLLINEIARLPEGTLVPVKHWPEMLFNNIHYDDMPLHEFPKNGPDAPYPELGYYPPKRELLEDPITDPTYDGKFYRHVEDTHTYFSTEKAGEIYTDLGFNVETGLYLTSVETITNPYYFDTNCFSYEYAGTQMLVQKGRVLDRRISDTDFKKYPKGGIAEDGYWYEYIGTNEVLEKTWKDYTLRSVPTYNIDINSSEDLTIGDVAGASFSVEVQGEVKRFLKYLGRKCVLKYDFKNDGVLVPFGTFTISDVSYINHSVSKITAYDNIKKFDKPILDFMLSLTYPMTAKQLWHIVCDYCEVPYHGEEEFLNSDALIYGAFGDNNLTARTVVSYIAQIAGGYIRCDKDGYAMIRNLMPVKNVGVYKDGAYEEISDNAYFTYYKNLPPLRTYFTNEAGATAHLPSYEISDQKTQMINEFPIDMMDTITYTSAGGTNFINFRTSVNSILDISDNPFVYNVEDENTATKITGRILDQFWLIYPIDRMAVSLNGVETDIESAPYNSNIQTFEFE